MAEAAKPTPPMPNDAPWARPHLRSGLKLGVDARAAAGARRFKLTDPVSGKDFSLTEQEHFLCQSASGAADLPALAARATARFGSEMDEAEVTAFFRRLHILGLLRLPEAERAAVRPAAKRTGAAVKDRLANRRAGTMAKAVEPADPADPAAPVSEAGPKAPRLVERAAAGKARPAPTAAAEMPRLAARLAARQAKSAAVSQPISPPADHPATEAASAPPQSKAPDAPAAPAAGPELPRLAARMAARRQGAESKGAAPDSESGPESDPESGAVAPQATVPAAAAIAAPVIARIAARKNRLMTLPASKADNQPPAETAPAAPAPLPGPSRIAARLGTAPQKPAETPGSRFAIRKARIREQLASRAEREAEASEPSPEPKPEVPHTATPHDAAAPAASAPPAAKPHQVAPKAAPASAAAPPPADDSADNVPPAADPLDLIAGNLKKPVAAGPSLFDIDQDDEEEDDFFGMGVASPRGGGGGGGGIGGGGFGAMGGGGGGRGGALSPAAREKLIGVLAQRQGGGGMGGGGGGAIAALGMGGGMGGMGGGGGMGAMGGGMGGRRAQMGAAQEPVRQPASLKFLDPTWLLWTLYIVFYPIKWALWLLVPAVTLAGLTLLQNWGALLSDIEHILAASSSLTLGLASLFIANLLSRLAQGVAIVAYGGKVGEFGMMLLFGFLPRFYIDRSAIQVFDRSAQLWSHGAPLLIRLGLFTVGVIGWAMTRESGTWLPRILLLIAHVEILHFVFTAVPFLPGDGQRWFGAYVGEPRILQKSLIAMRHVFFGAALPPNFHRPALWPMLMFGVAMVLSIFAVVGTAGYFIAVTFGGEMGGTGVALFLILVAAFILWMLALKATIGRRTAQKMAQLGPMAAMMGQAEAADPALGRVVDPDAHKEPANVSGAARVIWGLIIVGLLAVAFLPYSYEAGGNVDILPSSRAQAAARIDGEIMQIMVSEGETVTKGQVLAQLSSWDEQNQIQVTDAQLAGAQANLDRLLAGPKPEQVEVARRELDRAEQATEFSREEAERNQQLLASGTVSQSTYDRSRTQYESDLAALDVARANLDLAQSGATDEEIAGARAEVTRLTGESQFRRDELERTRIVAPMAGQVITSGLSLKLGSYLRVGEVLLEIEATDQVNAVISVPESDIALIEPGAEVRLRVRGHADVEIPGTVASISPSATEQGYGSVVQVNAVFDNGDGFLRTGMTGYAKVEAADMRVWEAYLRSLRRFFQVDVWSWIP